MPTTPNGLPYPAATDPPNGPLQIQQLAEAIDAFLPQRKTKPSATSLTNTVTVADDPHLQLSLGVGVWLVQAFLSVTGAAAGDYRTAWGITGGTLISRGCIGPGAASADSSGGVMRSTTASAALEAVYGTDGTSSALVREILVISMTATGTVKLRHAQGTANATATVLAANQSWLAYQKLTT